MRSHMALAKYVKERQYTFFTMPQKIVTPEWYKYLLTKVL